MHVTDKDFFAEQRRLDRESAALMLEWQLELLSPERREIHERFEHHPHRCRCFVIEGLQ